MRRKLFKVLKNGAFDDQFMAPLPGFRSRPDTSYFKQAEGEQGGKVFQDRL